MSDEKIDNREEMSELLRSFDENPYDTSGKTPEDVMRVFYQFNIPVLPVVSRRGTLIGVITKEAITAAMSDIERASSKKIDDFVTSIAKKMSFEDLLPCIAQTQEFASINIFGELQGRLTRADLVAALDPCAVKPCTEQEIEASREKQVMEWMIYLILEHLPRALYALNAEGRTIFFNSHFEDVYCAASGEKDVDHEAFEALIADESKNRCVLGEGGKGAPSFCNTELGLNYEKVPMYSGGELCGYLLYFGKSALPSASHAGSLSERLEIAERQIIVNELKSASGDPALAAKKLSITKAQLAKKCEKFSIVLDNKSGGASRSR